MAWLLYKDSSLFSGMWALRNSYFIEFWCTSQILCTWRGGRMSSNIFSCFWWIVFLANNRILCFEDMFWPQCNPITKVKLRVCIFQVFLLYTKNLRPSTQTVNCKLSQHFAIPSRYSNENLVMYILDPPSWIQQGLRFTLGYKFVQPGIYWSVKAYFSKNPAKTALVY